MARNNKDNKLDSIKQSRDRTPMPRPTVFKDKTKYDRNAAKDDRRDDEDDWWLDDDWGEINDYD